MKNCLKCGNELKIIYNHYYACDNCKSIVSLDAYEKFTSYNSNWYTQLCENESLWNKNFFENYNVISHEYYRIYELLNNNQIFGVLFQIKDLFEIIIKFPVLITIAYIYSQKEKDKEQYELLLSITDKPLSLGDWQSCAKKIYNKNYAPNKHIKNIIEDVYKIFDNENIVHWRNETIGHGALGLECDIEFQEDIVSKLNLLKLHFDKCEEDYFKINICDAEKINENLKTEDVFSNPEAMYWYDKNANSKYDLSPFILKFQHQLYFFDAFIHRKKKYDMLCYPIGKKKSFINDNISNEIESLHTACLSNLVRRDNESACMEVANGHLVDCENYLNSLIDKRYYQKVTYLNEWVTDYILKQEKGLFLLQMERGMGKTTFVKLFKKSIGNKAKNVEIKTLFLKDTIFSDTSVILQAIIDTLRQNDEEKLLFRENLIKFDSEIKKENFAQIFNHYLELYKNFYKKNKILFFFDGLDELKFNEYNNFYQNICEIGQLVEGIYLVFTCRTDDEIPEVQKYWKNSLIIEKNNKMIVKSDDEKNKNLIELYIKRVLPKSNTSLSNIIIESTEGLFLYVDMLILLFKKDYNFKNQIPKGKDILSNFIEYIIDNYGKKYSNKLIKVLYIVATAYEPLEINEIYLLAGEDKLTFEFLGLLCDINAFFKIDRTIRGNLYSISNSEYTDFIGIKQEFLKYEISKDWLNLLKINSLNNAKLYILAYLKCYLNWFVKNDLINIFSFNMLLDLNHSLDILDTENYLKFIKIRKYMIQKNINYILNEIFNSDDIDYKILSGDLNAKMGDCFFDRSYSDMEVCIQNYKTSIEKYQQMKELLMNTAVTTTDIICNYLEKKIINNRIDIGRVFAYAGKSDLANKEFELVEQNLLCSYNIKFNELDYFLFYLERARTYRNLNKLDLALKYVKLSSENFEKMKRIKNLNDIDEANINSFKYRLDECKATICLKFDNKRALYGIELLDSIDYHISQNKKRIKENELNINIKKLIYHDIAYSTLINSNIGKWYIQHKEFKAAIKYYRRVIRAYKYIEERGIAYEEINKIEAYSNIGSCYLDIGENEKCIENFRQSIYLLATTDCILSHNELEKINRLIHCILGISDAYYYLKEYIKSINYYNYFFYIIQKYNIKFTPEDMKLTLLRLKESYNKNDIIEHDLIITDAIRQCEYYEINMNKFYNISQILNSVKIIVDSFDERKINKNYDLDIL